MTPEQAVAREAIRYTQSVYNSEGDRGRLDGLVEAFTKDGVLAFDGVEHTGPEGIRAALSPNVDAKKDESAAGALIFLRHNLTTSRIEFTSADTADAWTYFQVMTPIGLDHIGVYIDKFVREGDRWLIAHRRVKIDWASPVSTMVGRLQGF
jgi:hypothetical protein